MQVPASAGRDRFETPTTEVSLGCILTWGHDEDGRIHISVVVLSLAFGGTF